MKKRIISIVLTAVLVISAAVIPANAGILTTAKNVYTAVTEGYPMANAADVLTGFNQIRVFINNLVGVKILDESTLVVTVDDTIQGIIDTIIKTTGVDFSEVYNNIPSTSAYAEVVTSTMCVDIPKLQTLLNETADNLYANGCTVSGSLIRITSVWFGIVDSCKIILDPVEGQSGVYRFAAVVTYRDGRTDTLYSDILYDKNTNEFRGPDGQPAILGFSMDLDSMTTYTGINVWQRKFGFCYEYDLFCFLTPYLMNYVTQRIKFNYNNEEWMCQIWKGTYFIANGGEVGFYKRPMGSTGTFYNCVDDDNMLTMTLDVYHKDDLLFHRGPLEHWWITGFQVDSVCYLPATLTLKSTITMKDKEMFDAFTKALDKKLTIKYETKGLDVSITW